MPSITRRTDKRPPQYRDNEESDIFVLSGAEDLVPVLLRVTWARALTIALRLHRAGELTPRRHRSSSDSQAPFQNRR